MERLKGDEKGVRLGRIQVVQQSAHRLPGLGLQHLVRRHAFPVDGPNRTSRVAIDGVGVVHPHPGQRDGLGQHSRPTSLDERTVEVLGVADTDPNEIRVEPNRGPLRPPGGRVNVFDRTEHPGGCERLPHRAGREGRGNPREHRQRLLVANVRAVGGINRTDDPKLRGRQTTRRCRADRPVNLKETLAQVVDRGHVTRAGQDLSNPDPTSPGTLEGLLKGGEHLPRLPVAVNGLRLEQERQVLAAIGGGLVLDTTVHVQHEVVDHLVVAATELLKAQNARGLEPLELHVVAIRGCPTANVHIQRHPQHLAQGIGLATEERARILAGSLHVREDGLMKNLNDFRPRLGARVLGEDLQIRGLLLRQEGLVGQDQLVDRVVIQQTVRVRDTGQRGLVDIAVGRTPKRPEDGEQRHGVTEPGKLDERETLVPPHHARHLVQRHRSDRGRGKHKEMGKRTLGAVLGHGLQADEGLGTLFHFNVGALALHEVNGLILLHQGLGASLGSLALAGPDIDHVVAEKLLGHENPLRSADNKVPAEFVGTFAGGMGIHRRQVAELAPKHQRDLAQDNVREGLDLRGLVRKLILHINVPPEGQGIGAVVQAAGVGQNGRAVALRGGFIAELGSLLASEVDPNLTTHLRTGCAVSEFKRDGIGDAKKGGDVHIEKRIEGIQMVLDEREVCVSKIGLKHVPGDLHCLHGSNHFRTDDEASPCGVKPGVQTGWTVSLDTPM